MEHNSRVCIVGLAREADDISIAQRVLEVLDIALANYGVNLTALSHHGSCSGRPRAGRRCRLRKRYVYCGDGSSQYVLRSEAKLED